MKHNDLFRLGAALATAALLAACAQGAGVPPVAATGSSAAASPRSVVRLPYADPYLLRDPNGNPIPNTHIMPTREAAANFAPMLVPHEANLVYWGGPIQKVPSIYVVYWGFNTDPLGEMKRLTAFLNAVGGSSWLGTDTQYYQKGQVYIQNPTGQLKGTWIDLSNPKPLLTKPTSNQVAAEAARLAQHFGVYDEAAAYIVATPSGHNEQGWPHGWCAYHSSITVHGQPINYTSLPYMSDAGESCGAKSVNNGTAGLLDGITIVGGHELAETQTDPVSADPAWYDRNGNENADKCAWYHLANTKFGAAGSFPTQPLWSNRAHGCVQ